MKYKSVNVKWDGKENVCSSCGRKPEYCYIATSHDHTDEVATMCDCGAGIPFAEFFKSVKNPTRPLDSFTDYIEPIKL
jgi:hypothetical protein